ELFPRIKERLSQVAGTLSGGEQQMVAMGRALMARPKLLCMDEPSMGLAPALVEQVFDIIQAINKQGTSIFMVEQNANMALSIAEYGYVIQTGEVVLHGSARSLRDNEMVQQAYLGEMGAVTHWGAANNPCAARRQKARKLARRSSPRRELRFAGAVRRPWGWQIQLARARRQFARPASLASST